ncbi:hypothetical protein RIF29_40064 [Crotalaria pallida]|uniref:Uncharacterized protein n=1 Tax=Crotalaria pallida TaxID=3830 RepID=A0AAN9E2U6_CROPI
MPSTRCAARFGLCFAVDELPLVEIELKKANCREKALKARDLKMSLEFIQKLLKEATTLQIEKEKQFVNLSCVLAVALPWEERAREILSHEAPISDFEDMIRPGIFWISRATYSDMVLTSMRFQNFKHLVLHCNGAEELFLSAIILLHWRSLYLSTHNLCYLLEEHGFIRTWSFNIPGSMLISYQFT